jgi:hypothetical protein
VVQKSVSPHSAFVLQQPAIPVWTQPSCVLESQLSAVQSLPSSQFVASAPAQLPPLQTSPVVHGLPSSHVLVVFAPTHRPLTVLHVDVTHTLPLLQTVCAPPTHCPSRQLSGFVHALPSLHVLVLSSVNPHTPVFGLQASSVHGLPSLQTVAVPPTQFPPLQ